MRSTFELLLLAFTLLWQQTAAEPVDSITWQQSGRSVVIKLDTLEYPLWVMDRKAPMHHDNAAGYYTPVDVPSAVLFNLTLSRDNKTLLLNHQPILPLTDVHVPPRIDAYQVPANTTEEQLRNIISYGVLDRKWEGMTLGWRYLSLDYDRLVFRDPQARKWNKPPVLNFRIMGIGAHARNDYLNAIYQRILRVELEDTNGACSGSVVSYKIADVSLLGVDEAYGSMPIEEHIDECTSGSWRCPDRRVHNPLIDGMELPKESPPYYRYIWRSRFDEFGRVGSMRHAVFEKIHVVSDFLEDAGPAMALSFVILFSIAMGILGLVMLVRYYAAWRIRRITELAEEDRLLGHKGADKQDRYVDEEENERPAVPPKDLIVTVQQEGSLI